MEYLNTTEKAGKDLDIILPKHEINTTRDLRYVQTYDDQGLIKLGFFDSVHPRRFGMQVFVEHEKELRFVGFSIKTRHDDHAQFPFLTDSGHHPDMRAALFVPEMISRIRSGDFGAVAGVRDKWINHPGVDDIFRQFVIDRSQHGDFVAGQMSWTAKNFGRYGLKLVGVRPVEDQIIGGLEKVYVYFEDQA